MKPDAQCSPSRNSMIIGLSQPLRGGLVDQPPGWTVEPILRVTLEILDTSSQIDVSVQNLLSAYK